MIGLVIKANGALLSVNIRNYFEDGVVFKKGLPVTTKKGERHGFGMKSIQLITESTTARCPSSPKTMFLI